ncbi:MAG: hypothetical protein ISS72_07285 [Candidatus Brocadiae bacterium]|nr:hypothetical protein [Candidatus Brocadiia bacterium]
MRLLGGKGDRRARLSRTWPVVLGVALIAASLVVRAVARDVAEPPPKALLKRIEAVLPAGWSVRTAGDTVTVSRNDEAEAYNAINLPTHSGIGDLRKGGFTFAHRYELTLRVGPHVAPDEFTRRIVANTATAKAMRELQARMRHISHKFDDYLPKTPADKKLVAGYRRLKAALHDLPDLYDDAHSIWSSDSLGFAVVFASDAVGKECRGVHGKVAALFLRYEAKATEARADAGLRWVDDKTGRVWFTAGDIVRFDWERQFFELKRRPAMAVMANDLRLKRSFTVRDEEGIIYRGTFMSLVSSSSFRGPTIVTGPVDKSMRPPLFRIDAGYPGRIEGDPDGRRVPRLRAALDRAGVLGAIDTAKPPKPIERLSSKWSDERGGLRARVELFPETFRIGEKARLHAIVFGRNDAHTTADVVEIHATVEANGGKFGCSTHWTLPLKEMLDERVHPTEWKPWGPVFGSEQATARPGPATLRVQVLTRKKTGETSYSAALATLEVEPMAITILPQQDARVRRGRPVVGRFVVAAGEVDWPRVYARVRDGTRVRVAADGSFRVEGVPQGDSWLWVSVPDRAAGGSLYDRHVAQTRRKFTVPPMPGGRSDEPLDLGVIRLPLKIVAPTRPPGEPPPRWSKPVGGIQCKLFIAPHDPTKTRTMAALTLEIRNVSAEAITLPTFNGNTAILDVRVEGYPKLRSPLSWSGAFVKPRALPPGETWTYRVGEHYGVAYGRYDGGWRVFDPAGKTYRVSVALLGRDQSHAWDSRPPSGWPREVGCWNGRVESNALSVVMPARPRPATHWPGSGTPAPLTTPWSKATEHGLQTRIAAHAGTFVAGKPAHMRLELRHETGEAWALKGARGQYRAAIAVADAAGEQTGQRMLRLDFKSGLEASEVRVLALFDLSDTEFGLKGPGKYTVRFGGFAWKPRTNWRLVSLPPSPPMAFDLLASAGAAPPGGAAGRDKDVVAEELRKVVELRQRQVDRTKALYRKGVASQPELAEAEIALADARVRLAEREGAGGTATAELRRIVELRQQQAARVKTLVERGVATQAELAEAEIALADARIRLAEREGAEDTATAELRRVVELRQRQVARVRTLVKAGRAPGPELAEAEVKLAEARARLAARARKRAAPPKKGPVAPQGLRVPKGWDRAALLDALARGLKRLADAHLPGHTLVRKDAHIRLAWRTQRYEDPRSADERRRSKMPVLDPGPAPDGLIVRVRFGTPVWQAVRPQTLDIAGLWKTYLGQIALPTLKTWLDFDLDYGPKTAAKLRETFSSPRAWLDAAAAEAKGPPAGALEFRIVPNRMGSSRLPVLGPAKRLVDDLAANGPLAGRQRGDEFQWFALRGNVGELSVTADYKGRKRMLLCGRKPYVMAAAHGWGLERVFHVIDGGTGASGIHVQFDNEGAGLFEALTRANVGNAVAIVIDGEVMSAPVIRSAVRGEVVITGSFTAAEAEALAAALRAGMPARRAAPRPFLGVPEGETLEHQVGAIGGVPKMTAVEITTAERYLEFKEEKRIKAEERRGEWVYFAVDSGLHVPMGNVGAYVNVTRRYKALVATTFAGAVRHLADDAIVRRTFKQSYSGRDQNPTGLGYRLALRLSGQEKDFEGFTKDRRYFRRDMKALAAGKKTWALCALLDHPNSDAKVFTARALLELADPASVPALLAAAKANNYGVRGSENATIHSIYRSTLRAALEKTTGMKLTPKGLRVTTYPKPGQARVVRSEDDPSFFGEEVDFARVEEWLRKRPSRKP